MQSGISTGLDPFRAFVRVRVYSNGGSLQGCKILFLLLSLLPAIIPRIFHYFTSINIFTLVPTTYVFQSCLVLIQLNAHEHVTQWRVSSHGASSQSTKSVHIDIPIIYG